MANLCSVLIFSVWQDHHNMAVEEIVSECKAKPLPREKAEGYIYWTISTHLLQDMQ